MISNFQELYVDASENQKAEAANRILMNSDICHANKLHRRREWTHHLRVTCSTKASSIHLAHVAHSDDADDIIVCDEYAIARSGMLRGSHSPRYPPLQGHNDPKAQKIM